MSNINLYIENIKKLIENIENYEIEKIESAARIVADSLIKGNWIYAFGTGHSHMLAEEIFYRAGGMVKIYPILCTELMLHEGAVKSTAMERLTGYAKVILDDYPVKSGDTIFIFSNSGRNPVPVEMAMEAKKLGLIVIAITNISHSSKCSSRHSSGKRLFEVADLVIDNRGEFGDACIEVANQKVAPTSTVIGSMIMNAIVARTAEIITESSPDNFEFFSSSNTDEGEVKNKKLISKYKSIVAPM